MTHETGSEFLASWAHNAEIAQATPTIRAQEHDACGVGLVAALDGKKRRDVVQAGIDALKAVWHRGAVDADGKTGDGAGIHVEIPQDFFAEEVRRGGDRLREGPIAVGMVFLPKTDLSAQERCRADRRGGDPQLRLPHLWLAPGADQRRVHRREGQCHAPRDRADHDLEPARRVRGGVRARTLHHPPQDREGGDRRADPRALSLLAVLPLDHLQGHVPGGEPRRISIPTCTTSASSRASRSTTSAIPPTPSPPGGWRSPSACWRITARSTPSPATSTG